MFREISDAINKTSEKHPEYTMSSQLYGALNKYYNVLKNEQDPVAALNEFYKCFSKYDKDGHPLREKLEGIMLDHDRDGALELYRFVYQMSLMLLRHHSSRQLTDPELTRYTLYYVKEFESLNKGYDLNSIRDKIYNNPKLINGLNNIIFPILEHICILIKPKEAINREVKSGIVFNVITDTAGIRITNVKENKIENSFGAVLDQGRIQLAAYVGNNKTTQEDAVLSMRREDCTLNVVADGMGGYAGGDKASMLVVRELANWFSRLDLSYVPRRFTTVQRAENNTLFGMIGNKLQEINDMINETYYAGKKTPGSTVVLSFSTPEYTLIVNIGDSTAYLKTDRDYELISTIDASPSISKRIVEDYIEIYKEII